MTKYFGIGLSRTGTRSLCGAFKILGFKSKHFLKPSDFKNVSSYDFANDLPIPREFEKLDKRFPGSKFIYTVRDIDSWISSCRKHWASKRGNIKEYKKRYRMDAYGTVKFDEDKLRQAYINHDRKIREYFKDRPKDLLIMNICACDGWETLIPFIGKENFDWTNPFPRLNQSGENIKKGPTLTIAASNKNRLRLDDPLSQWFLKSIQWQTYRDFELLIADGGSDNYEELEKYFRDCNSRIPMRIFQHKFDGPFQRALMNNVGVRQGRGEYIMTTDVDMLFAKDFVEKLMNKVNPNTLVESRTMYLKSKQVKMVHKGELNLYDDFKSCQRGRLKKRTTAGGCQCMHIDGWNKVRGFDEKYIGWGSEDFDLYKRVGKAGLKRLWLNENVEECRLFHQAHPKPDIKKDLEYQEENKKILNNIRSYRANPKGWGGIDG